MPQTSYQVYHDKGFAGDRYDIDDNASVVTMTNPVDAIYFGRGVAKAASTADGIQKPVDNTCDFVGIAVRDINQATAGYFPALSAIPVGKTGKFLVEVLETVTPDDAVLMYVGADTTKKGCFCKTADGTNTVAITSAKFVLIDSFTDQNSVKVALISLLQK